jgi:hypothetical protein
MRLASARRPHAGERYCHPERPHSRHMRQPQGVATEATPAAHKVLASRRALVAVLPRISHSIASFSTGVNPSIAEWLGGYLLKSGAHGTSANTQRGTDRCCPTLCPGRAKTGLSVGNDHQPARLRQMPEVGKRSAPNAL